MDERPLRAAARESLREQLRWRAAAAECHQSPSCRPDWARTPVFEINGLKREELIAASSVILHEIYFDSLGGHGDNPPSGAEEPPAGLVQALERDFGSVKAWRTEFTSMAKALAGGSGWAILAWSER